MSILKQQNFVAGNDKASEAAANLLLGGVYSPLKCLRFCREIPAPGIRYSDS